MPHADPRRRQRRSDNLPARRGRTPGESGGELRRTLGLGDAMVVGAGSMVGAGVFSAWSPAAGAAGNGLLIGLAIAAAVAFCNATSSAQLAAVHPVSGGTYEYGRRRLGPAWGHLAGWGFVVGKTASCAAIALTAGSYLWPEHDRVVAVAAVVAVTAVNLGGLERTVWVTKGLLAVALAVLGAVVAGGWSAQGASLARLIPVETSLHGVLQSAGFLFFAFAGYARIATLGEEVRNPSRVIPRAVVGALAGVLCLYAVVGVTTLAVLPAPVVASAPAPLRSVVEAGPLEPLAAMVRAGAGIAALGVLLNLVPGVSRTLLAMARNREVPAALARVEGRRAVPLRAELTVAVAVLALVAVLDLRNAIGVSGVAVLTYYAVTNAAALRLGPGERRWPRLLAVMGFAGCVVLIASLPWRPIATGTAVLGVGVVVRLLSLARRRQVHLRSPR